MTMQQQIKEGQGHVSALILAKATVSIEDISWAVHANMDTSTLTISVKGKIRKYDLDNHRLQNFYQEDNRVFLDKSADAIALDIKNGT